MPLEKDIEAGHMSAHELHCTVRIGARLGAEWSASFEGFRIEPRGGDECALVGSVADQAALHGVIARIRDLGLPLLGVEIQEEGRMT